MMANEEKTVLVTVRVSKNLLDQFDAIVRERAYKANQRITRNSAIVELMQSAVHEYQKDFPKND